MPQASSREQYLAPVVLIGAAAGVGVTMAMASASRSNTAGHSSATGGPISPALGAAVGVFLVALALLVLGRRTDRSTSEAGPTRRLVQFSVPLLALTMVAAAAVSVHTALVPDTDTVSTGSDVAAAKTTPAASSSDMSGMDMSGNMDGMDMSGHAGAGGSATPPTTDMSGMDMTNMPDMPGMDNPSGSATSATTPMANMPGMNNATPAGNSSMAGMNMNNPTPSNTTPDMSGMPGMPGMPAPKATIPGAPPTTMPPMPGMPGMPKPDPSWKYTGPPLPATTINMINMVQADTDAGHAMQTPNCSTPPTAAQTAAAAKYVADTSAAVAKYKDLSVAKADGYVPITAPNYPVVHYYKPSYMKSEYILDPSHVQSLVYALTPNGPVLAAGMYIMPFGSGDGPMPYGCAVQWHKHTNLCMSNTLGYYVGFAPCPSGTTLIQTPYMSHVWQVPVPGGQLALDPTDLQVVESAVMSQSAGAALAGPPPSGPNNAPAPADNGALAAITTTSGGGGSSSKRTRP